VPKRSVPFEVDFRFLDSADTRVRVSSEEILVEHLGVGYHRVEPEIRRRELAGESAQAIFPEERTVVILNRTRKKGRPLTETQ